MSTIRPSQDVEVTFYTRDADGVTVNADALPTAQVFNEAAADGAVAVTVANISAGFYSASFAVPATYVSGDNVDLVIDSYDIGGVAVGGRVEERFTVQEATAASPTFMPTPHTVDTLSAAAGATGDLALTGDVPTDGIHIITVGTEQIRVDATVDPAVQTRGYNGTTAAAHANGAAAEIVQVQGITGAGILASLSDVFLRLFNLISSR